MHFLVLLSAIILIVLILLQVRDGGLNVMTNASLRAPIERRGPAKTWHMLTIIASVVFIAGSIALFLS